MTIMNIMMSISWSMFILTSRPVHKILTLCFNLIFVMLLMSYMTKTSWFSMIFIMLMISGLLILFFYIGSIQQNTMIQNSEFSFKYIASVAMTLFLVISSKTIHSNDLLFTSSSMTSLNIYNSTNSNIWVLLLFTLLLIFMLMNLELISNFNSPLRSKTN